MTTATLERPASNDAATAELLPAAAAPRLPGLSLGSLQLPGETPAELALASIAVGRVIAKELASIIRERKLFVTIRGREYVLVDGWTTMAAMLGVAVREVETHEHPTVEGEFVSTVEAIRVIDGAVIGRATHRCGAADDRPWNTRPRMARASMSQTRACGKVLRLLFSWIMPLAGYSPTPAEEMPDLPESRPEKPKPKSDDDILAFAGTKIAKRVADGGLTPAEAAEHILSGLAHCREELGWDQPQLHKLRTLIMHALIAHAKVDRKRVGAILEPLREELSPDQQVQITNAMAVAAKDDAPAPEDDEDSLAESAEEAVADVVDDDDDREG